jgi:hypothetical protein
VVLVSFPAHTETIHHKPANFQQHSTRPFLAVFTACLATATLIHELPLVIRSPGARRWPRGTFGDINRAIAEIAQAGYQAIEVFDGNLVQYEGKSSFAAGSMMPG